MLPVSTRDIVVSASAAGSVEPVRTVEVKSKASGEILEVRVETGDRVRPGQLLVKVDPRVPQNALRQAEADLEVAKAQLTNAEAQFRRSEELYKSQSITETEWETAVLNSANAKAQLVRAERSAEDARISFEDTDVRAAIEGTIIEKAVEVGTVISSATSNVSGGAVLLRMANLDTVQVRSLVDETDIGKIEAGMAVQITVDAYPNRPFRGQVLTGPSSPDKKFTYQIIAEKGALALDKIFPIFFNHRVKICPSETESADPAAARMAVLLKPGAGFRVEVERSFEEIDARIRFGDPEGWGQNFMVERQDDLDQPCHPRGPLGMSDH